MIRYHVSADGRGGVSGDALGRRPSSIWDDVERRPAYGRGLAEEQEGQQRDGDEGECCAERRLGDLEARVAQLLGRLGQVGLVVFDVALDVQLVDDVADRALAVGGIVHSSGKISDDVDELRLHRQDEQRDHPRQHQERADNDCAGGDRSSTTETSIQAADQRGEDDGHEPGDGDPRQDADGSEQQNDDQVRRDDDPDRGEDRSPRHISPLAFLAGGRFADFAADGDAATWNVETVMIRRPRHVVHGIKPSRQGLALNALADLARRSSDQVTYDIDGNADDDGTEDVGQKRVTKHSTAYGALGDASVGYLKCHTDGERDIREVHVVRRIIGVGKVDSARGLAVVQAGVPQDEQRVNGEPRQEHGEDSVSGENR